MDNLRNKVSENKSGISFLGLLGLAFIILRLVGVIDWSWWYVTLPLWGPIAIALAILAIAGIVALIAIIVYR